MQFCGLPKLGRYSRLWIVLAGLVVTTSSITPVDAKRRTKKERKVWQKYKALKGEKISRIARALGVSANDIRRWNRLKGNTLKRRKRLKFRGKRIRHESRGRTNRGFQTGAYNLDRDGDRKGIGWALSKRRVATWGTSELIWAIRKCGRVYRRQFPIGKGPSIPIGDLSSRHGGPLPPHVSHQSGRDVDIGFIRKKPLKRGHFTNTRPKDMDLYKQWVLLKCFLDNPETQMIIMERSVVKALEAYIRDIYSRKSHNRRRRMRKLRAYLRNFPKGSRRIIRADTSHKSHMHVRMKCAKNDKKCVP